MTEPRYQRQLHFGRDAGSILPSDTYVNNWYAFTSQNLRLFRTVIRPVDFSGIDILGGGVEPPTS